MMARQTGRASQLVKCLNSARDANILNEEDAEEVENLVLDYFNSNEAQESISEDEDDDQEDEEGEVTIDESEDEANESDTETLQTVVDTAIPFLHIDLNNGTPLNTDTELNKVQAFDCKCKLKCYGASSASVESESMLNSGSTMKTGCVVQFSTNEILVRRMDMAELSEAEKDFILLGILASTPMNTSEMTLLKPCRRKKRQHQKTTYIIDSKVVCRETFKFCYGISQNKLTALLKHYKEHGVTPRQKKSGGRKYNTRAFSPEDIERAVLFLRHFAEDHALVLPGRYPGFRRADVKILPSSQTKTWIWRHYRDISLARGFRAMGKSSFFHTWQQHVPFIVVGRPLTDLCWRCKQNNDRIRQTVNLPEDERIAILGEQMEHLQNVERERRFYNDLVADAKETAAAQEILNLGPHRANSLPVRFHYSFDFAQQVHLPSSPLQPGPIYFLVPRKCGIFGVCAEGISQQINYLIDEGMSSGKGSNMVISLLHHFLEHYGIGEMFLDLHCDNCSGQNKNKFMMWYLAWRTMIGLHTEITVNFMPAGHTKFAPDWCFGLLKRRFKVSEVHSLDDLCHVVSSSSRKGVNRPQLVGNEAGDVFVPVYDWQSFFDGWFRPLKGIKSMFHFRFSCNNLGCVFLKKTLDDEETRFDLAFHGPDIQQRLTGMPPVVPPPGLSPARQQYLRQQIRPFVRPSMQDRLCP